MIFIQSSFAGGGIPCSVNLHIKLRKLGNWVSSFLAKTSWRLIAEDVCCCSAAA